ncbi:MAG: hypothetical protein ABH814_01915 [bacterium]
MEIVLVTGLVAVIGVIAARFMVSFFDSYNKSKVSVNVENTGRDLLHTFEAEIRNAKSVSLESPTQLTIVKQSDEVWSLCWVAKDCAADNSNNFVSFSAQSGGAFPEIPLTPVNSLSGVNVVSLEFSENNGSIAFEVSLENACGLPDKARFRATSSYKTEIRPRSIYND